MRVDDQIQFLGLRCQCPGPGYCVVRHRHVTRDQWRACRAVEKPENPVEPPDPAKTARRTRSWLRYLKVPEELHLEVVASLGPAPEPG